jgi:hypothetical protein
MTAPERLYLAYDTERPPLATYDIKRQAQRRFFGSEFVFFVIGDSHCVCAPTLGFYELFSCKPIRQGRVATVELPAESGLSNDRCPTESRCSIGAPASDDGQTIHSGRYRLGPVGVTTTIRREPISAFPGPKQFDIAYRFEPGAYTAINCRSAITYETYHTYPEYGLALYSEHTFTDLAADTADDTPAYETPATEIN